MATQVPFGPEALSKGVYGMIVLMAGLGELGLHQTPASHVMAAIVGTGVMLVVAHSYAELLADGYTGSDRPRHVVRRALSTNLALVGGMIPALGLFVLAGTGGLPLSLAYRFSMWWVLVMLFAFGAGAALAHGRGVPAILLSGALAAVLGLAVAGFELLLA